MDHAVHHPRAGSRITRSLVVLSTLRQSFPVLKEFLLNLSVKRQRAMLLVLFDVCGFQCVPNGDRIAATIHEDAVVRFGNGRPVQVDRLSSGSDAALLRVRLDLLKGCSDGFLDRQVVGWLPAVTASVLAQIHCLLRPVPAQTDDVRRRLARKGRLRQCLDHGVLLRRAGSEQVDLPAAPALLLRVFVAYTSLYPSG